jgi:hypothetical protein
MDGEAKGNIAASFRMGEEHLIIFMKIPSQKSTSKPIMTHKYVAISFCHP